MCNTMSWNIICKYNSENNIERVISEYYAVCQIKVERLMQRMKNTIYIGLIVLGLTLNPVNSLLSKFSLGPKDAFALTTSIHAEDQSTINLLEVITDSSWLSFIL